jgi:hypothetical protein
MSNFCYQCAKATYRGLTAEGAKYLIKERRIKCLGYPNPKDREILVKNPLLCDEACYLFAPIEPAEKIKRISALEKFGIKIT